MPGSPSGLLSRLSTPSVAFALTTRARLLLFPANGGAHVTARQASLDATDRSLAPPRGAFDAGLRPDPFPDRTASLLPSLLAATRTGLTPAGDDELMLDQLLNQHPQLWMHTVARPQRASQDRDVDGRRGMTAPTDTIQP